MIYILMDTFLNLLLSSMQVDFAGTHTCKIHKVYTINNQVIISNQNIVLPLIKLKVMENSQQCQQSYKFNACDQNYAPVACLNNQLFLLASAHFMHNSCKIYRGYLYCVIVYLLYPTS